MAGAIVTRADQEAMRCAALSGNADPRNVLRLLDYVGLLERDLTMKRTREAVFGEVGEGR